MLTILSKCLIRCVALSIVRSCMRRGDLEVGGWSGGVGVAGEDEGMKRKRGTKI